MNNPMKMKKKDTFYDGFAFRKRVTVKDEIYIDQHNIIADLFAMTPIIGRLPYKAANV